ncbi:MAG: hypothetical protein V5A48_06970 [Salinivenus sp.]
MPTSATDRPEVDLPDKDRYTYEDYQQLPEGAPYELIRGHLVLSPSPTVHHQRLVFRLGTALHERHVDTGTAASVLLDGFTVELKPLFAE